MSALGDTLGALATVLDGRGLRWLVFGAQAVSVRAPPRATQDVDVTVEVPREELEDLVAALALSQRGCTVDSTIEHNKTGRLATLRTMSPSGATEARRALELIDERGYGRGRKLLDELQHALDDLGPSS